MKETVKRAHSYIEYRCRDCKRDWFMYCVKGVEDGPKSKIAPSPIRCSCGGLAFQHGQPQMCLVWRKIDSNDSFFDNHSGCRMGIPILRGKIHEINRNAAEAKKIKV